MYAAYREVSEISGIKLRNASQGWKGQKIPQTVGFPSREIDMMTGCLPVFLLGPTDKFVSFALCKLGTCKKLARGASSLQGFSNHNQIKYHGLENKSSCLTQKGNSFDGKKNCFRSTQNDFLSVQLPNPKHNYLHSFSFYCNTLSWKYSCTVNLSCPAGVTIISQDS